jgi:hypothetical protein
MFQPPLSVGPEDDHITLLRIRCVQDFFSRVTFLDNDLGYEIDTWRSDLGLYVLTKLLQQFFDLDGVLLLLFFLISLNKLEQVIGYAFVCVLRRIKGLDAMKNDNLCVMCSRQIGGIVKCICRVL